jgi:hypothetical protein
LAKDNREYATQWPTFCPVLLRKSSGDELLLFPHKSLYELVVVFRDFLRLVWRRDSATLREQVPKILLGLANQPLGHEPIANQEIEQEWVAVDTSSPISLAKSLRMREMAREQGGREREEERSKRKFRDFDPRIRRALWALQHDPETDHCRPWWPLLVVDWERSEFTYEPANDFQRAIYALLRQSWRARICRECQRFFIAEKHPQMFCGVACSTVARQKRDREFWKSKGNALRKIRNKKHRESGNK